MKLKYLLSVSTAVLVSLLNPTSKASASNAKQRALAKAAQLKSDSPERVVEEVNKGHNFSTAVTLVKQSQQRALIKKAVSVSSDANRSPLQKVNALSTLAITGGSFTRSSPPSPISSSSKSSSPISSDDEFDSEFEDSLLEMLSATVKEKIRSVQAPIIIPDYESLIAQKEILEEEIGELSIIRQSLKTTVEELKVQASSLPPPLPPLPSIPPIPPIPSIPPIPPIPSIPSPSSSALHGDPTKIGNQEERIKEYEQRIQELEETIGKLTGKKVESSEGTPIWIPINHPDGFIHDKNLKKGSVIDTSQVTATSMALKNYFETEILTVPLGIVTKNKLAQIQELTPDDPETMVKVKTVENIHRETIPRLSSVEKAKREKLLELYNAAIKAVETYQEEKKKQIPGLAEYITVQKSYKELMAEYPREDFIKFMEDFTKRK